MKKTRMLFLSLFMAFPALSFAEVTQSSAQEDLLAQLEITLNQTGESQLRRQSRVLAELVREVADESGERKAVIHNIASAILNADHGTISLEKANIIQEAMMEQMQENELSTFQMATIGAILGAVIFSARKPSSASTAETGGFVALGRLLRVTSGLAVGAGFGAGWRKLRDSLSDVLEVEWERQLDDALTQ